MRRYENALNMIRREGPAYTREEIDKELEALEARLKAAEALEARLKAGDLEEKSSSSQDASAPRIQKDMDAKCVFSWLQWEQAAGSQKSWYQVSTGEHEQSKESDAFVAICMNEFHKLLSDEEGGAVAMVDIKRKVLKRIWDDSATQAVVKTHYSKMMSKIAKDAAANCCTRNCAPCRTFCADRNASDEHDPEEGETSEEDGSDDDADKTTDLGSEYLSVSGNKQLRKKMKLEFFNHFIQHLAGDTVSSVSFKVFLEASKDMAFQYQQAANEDQVTQMLKLKLSVINYGANQVSGLFTDKDRDAYMTA